MNTIISLDWEHFPKLYAILAEVSAHFSPLFIRFCACIEKAVAGGSLSSDLRRQYTKRLYYGEMCVAVKKGALLRARAF